MATAWTRIRRQREQWRCSSASASGTWRRTRSIIFRGQRQLASLAQAIVRDPQILLLDEPTSALDLRYQLVVMDIVRQFARKGRLVIVVVHDLGLAARWADRMVLLRRGDVRAVGTPAEALTPATLQDVYGVRARVEHCSLGTLQIIVDATTDDRGAAVEIHATAR